jgi:glycosyltransferase involved in cell wall biosynthesis
MKVLIVPDIVGWVVEDMALNIMEVLKDDFEFTLKYADDLALKHDKEVINWKTDYDKYDVIFMMLPSYIPKDLPDISKVVTCFHGGPGTEGQADMLQRFGYADMRIAYVSEQTKYRVTDQPFENVKQEKVPLRKHIDEEWLYRDLLKLSPADNMKIIQRPHVEDAWVTVQIRYRRVGFGFNKLYFTPHGVDTELFKQDRITQNFVCGYAGWANYLMGAQNDHRRGRWIMDAYNKDFRNTQKFNIAAGIEEHDNGNKRRLLNGMSQTKRQNLTVKLYEHNEMPEFYKKISTYLVPDFRAGGPMPVLEAGAMGIPVVTTNAGLCGDIIEDGVHGKIIKTYAEFVDAINFMKNNPKDREKMGENLREYIRENRRWVDVKGYWASFLLGEKI